MHIPYYADILAISVLSAVSPSFAVLSRAHVLSRRKLESFRNMPVWARKEGLIFRGFDSNLCRCFKRIIYLKFEVPVFEKHACFIGQKTWAPRPQIQINIVWCQAVITGGGFFVIEQC